MATKSKIFIDTIKVSDNVSNVRKLIHLPQDLVKMEGILIDGYSIDIDAILQKLPDYELDICSSFALPLTSPLIADFITWAKDRGYLLIDDIDSSQKIAFKYYDWPEEIDRLTARIEDLQQRGLIGSTNMIQIGDNLVVVESMWISTHYDAIIIAENLTKINQRYFSFTTSISPYYVLAHKLFAVGIVPVLHNHLAGNLSISKESGEIIYNDYPITINSDRHIMHSVMSRNDEFPNNSTLVAVFRDAIMDNAYLKSYKIDIVIFYT